MKNKERIVFLNLSIFYRKDFIDYPYYSNLGMLSCAGIISKYFQNIFVFDSFTLPQSSLYKIDDEFLLGVPVELILQNLKLINPDILIINNTQFLSLWKEDSRFIEFFKKIKFIFKDLKIILADFYIGGMHYIDYDEDLIFKLYPSIDFICKYGCEESLPLVLKEIIENKNSQKVYSFPQFEGKLDDLPYPVFELIDIRNFQNFVVSSFIKGKWKNIFNINEGSFPVLASRGCPYKCIFCTSNPQRVITKRKAFKKHSLNYLKNYFEYLKKNFSVQKIIFLDEMANLRDDFFELLLLLKYEKLKYEFPNGLRSDRLSEEEIKEMKENISVLSISAESGNERVLNKIIKKGLKLLDVENVARLCAKYEIPLFIHYIIGLPEERKHEINETLNHAWKMSELYNANPLIQYATPFSGTEFFNICLKENLFVEPWKKIDGAYVQHKPVIKTADFSPQFLKSAKEIFDEKINASKEKKIIINITYRCNNNCVFCAVGNRSKIDGDFEEHKKIIDFYSKKGIKLIDFDGGEPTLYPHLIRLIKYAKKKGFEKITLTTNARTLFYPDVAKKIIKSGITMLLISIHGHNKEIHEWHTRKEGSFYESVRGLQNAIIQRDEDIEIGVNTTITKKNFLKISEFARFVYSFGVRVLNIQFLTPFGRANPDILPDLRKARKVVGECIEKWSYRMKINVINLPLCYMKGYEKYLVPDLYKIGRNMIFITNENVNLYKYLAKMRKREKKCDECEYSIGCDGFYIFEE